MTYSYDQYGYHQYGDSVQEVPEQFRKAVPKKRQEISPYEAFGSGIALAPSDVDDVIPWDIESDTSGDIAHTQGYDELIKDFAWKSASNLRDHIYAVNSEKVLKKIRKEVQSFIEGDDRIAGGEVLDVSFGTAAHDMNRIYVDVAITPDGQNFHRHIFPL